MVVDDFFLSLGERSEELLILRRRYVALYLCLSLALEVLCDETLVVHLKVILHILQGRVIIAYHQVGIFAHDVYLLNLLLVEFIEHPIVFLLVAQARLLDAANRHRIVEYQKSSLQLHGSYFGEIEQGFLHVFQLQGRVVGEERLLAGFQIVQKFDDRKL